MSRYINPFTDFGFKKLFGNEKNNDIIIGFLNQILPTQDIIQKITYHRTEHLGASEIDRKVIYDLYCENQNGEKFIVELQKAKQVFFKDRSLYYATFPIQEQAQRGDWDYQLKAVYTVAILDFCFDEHNPNVRVEVKLMDTTRKVIFYDKLAFVYLQMPNFRKQEDQLETLQDKWLFLLKNLASLDQRPQKLKEKIFDKFFEEAEIAKFSKEDRVAYENSLKYYRDIKNSLDTAFEEGIGIGEQIGLEKGKIEGKIEIARNMIADKETNDKIAKYTGLTEGQINAIREEMKP